jgi:chitodextrinase/photosystem II stability/assembly factor-like uncharacterized protein
MGAKKLKEGKRDHLSYLKLLLLFAVFLFAALPAWAGINQWMSNGPYGVTISSLAVSPNYLIDQTIFAGTYDEGSGAGSGQGVFKSTDGGISWVQVNTGLTNLDIRSVVVSPNYSVDQTVFAGTNFGGIFKSTNSGNSWIQLENFPGLLAQALSISPNYVNDQTIFAAWHIYGLYKSTDGGASWTQTGLTSEEVEVIAISPNYANDDTIFVGTSSGGVFKSTDGGISWIPVNTGLSSLYLLSLSISPTYTIDNTLFTSVFIPPPGPATFKSTNGGNSWVPVFDKVSRLLISPNYANNQTVFISSAGGIYKSTNGGSSWINLPNSPSGILAIAPNYPSDPTIFVGTSSQGVFSFTFPTTIQLHRTGQTTSYYPGDDGDIQAGVAWPDPRFTDNGDGTITDNLTGLVWTKDAGTPTANSCTGGTKAWQDALDYVACLNTNNYLGHNDWRLPNINELESLSNAGEPSNLWLDTQGFYNFQSGYWSSTSVSGYSVYAWAFRSGVGPGGIDKTYDGYYFVLPVRSVTAPPAQIQRTGQTISYAPNDDGDIEAGVVWPTPRFTDDGDGTVTDNLTGLLWTKDASTPTVGSCTGGTTTWQDALNYVACLNSNNYLGHSDWRLPNKEELGSLIDYGQSNPALQNGHPFINVYSGYGYWLSTTYAAWDINAHLIYIADLGSFAFDYKTASHYYVWPVRGGIVSAPLDTTPPVTSLSSNPASPDGNSGWFKTTPTITLNRNEPGTTYWYYKPGYSYTYSTPFNAPDGQYTIYYYSIDTSGNTEPVKQQSFKVDTIPPSIMNNVALNKPAYASSSYNSTPGEAFDGDKSVGNMWNAGNYAPQWIYVDLQQNYDIAQIRLYVEQYPDGNTTHNIYTSQDASNWTLVKTLSGYTSCFQTLIVDFSPSLSNVRYVKVETVSSPSWVAWTEIEVYNTIPPVSPALSATGVSISANITATFNEDIDPSTINSATFILKDSTNNLVPGSVSYNSSTKTATFVPSINLAYSTTYTATVTTGVTDLAGNNMTSNIFWSFTTEASSVTTPPVTSLSVNPSSPNGQNGWFITAPSITLSMNEPGTTYYRWHYQANWTTYTGAFNAQQGNNTLYYYSVDTAGSPELVKSATFKVDTQPPTVPFDVRAIPMSSSQINLTWNASTDATSVVAGYTIYNADDGSELVTTTSTSYPFTGLSPNTTYRYYVKAYDEAGNISGQSSTASATTYQAPVPTPPGSNVSVNLGNSVSLTFSQVTNSGTTSVTLSTIAPGPAPAGFSFMAIFYDITTTASYTPPILVTLPYDESLVTGSEANLRLFHWENGAWQDVTFFVDTANNTITGRVNSLSPFVIGNPLTPDTTPPTSVTLSGNLVTSSRIDLSWTASTDTGSGLDHYEIYDASTNNLLTSTANNFYSFTGLTLNTTFGYYVKAVDTAGNKSASSNVLQTTAVPCFTQPLFADFEPNNSLTTVVFGPPRNIVPSPQYYGYINNSTDEDWYQVYAYAGQTIDLKITVQSTGTNVGWAAMAPDGTIGHQATGLGTSIPSDQYSFTVPPGGDGYYAMRVWNVNGNNVSTRYDFDVKVTPQSDTICPSSVTNLVATPISSSEINLSWSSSTDNKGPTGYGICNLGTNLFVGTSKTSCFRVKNLSPNTTYTFGVGAFDAGGNFSGGSVVTVTTPSVVTDTTPPTVPYNVRASSVSSSQINLSWNASTDNVGVAGYKIYRNGAYLKSVNTTSTPDTGLSPNTQYCYNVSAYDAAGNESAQGSQACVTTYNASSPPTGQNNVSVDLGNGIHLTFPNIIYSCTISVTVLGTVPGPVPTGYNFIGSIYDISTCLSFNFTPPVTITLPYDKSLVPYGKEGTLQMFHWNGSSWDYVPCTVDPVSNTITGQANSLSPFVIGYPIPLGPTGPATGANTNMIAFLALIAISTGVLLMRKRLNNKVP